jgi:hypothetical protein
MKSRKPLTVGPKCSIVINASGHVPEMGGRDHGARGGLEIEHVDGIVWCQQWLVQDGIGAAIVVTNVVAGGQPERTQQWARSDEPKECSPRSRGVVGHG